MADDANLDTKRPKIGRPRGPLSDVEREARRRGGLSSRSVRGGSSLSAPDQSDTDAHDDPDVLTADLLSDVGDPRVARRFSAYIRRLGSGRDWAEVLTIEKARREIATATAAAVELEREAGRLVDRAEVDKAAVLVRDAWWKSAQQIVSDTLASLPGLPVEARELIKTATSEAVNKAAERVKESLA